MQTLHHYYYYFQIFVNKHFTEMFFKYDIKFGLRFGWANAINDH